MGTRTELFSIREERSLSACLFPYPYRSSGLGLPVRVSQLCSPGSVVLLQVPAPLGRPCARAAFCRCQWCAFRVTSAVRPSPVSWGVADQRKFPRRSSPA